jgi:hypothetical protein
VELEGRTARFVADDHTVSSVRHSRKTSGFCPVARRSDDQSGARHSLGGKVHDNARVRSLRLFGELHLDGFEVSHTKDGFRWDENEQPFLELLKEHLDDDDLPLLRQADNYRAIAARGERAKAAKEAVERTTTALSESLPSIIVNVAEKEPIETPSISLQQQNTLASKSISFKFRQEDWTIKIELSDDPAESQWLAISDVVDQPSSTRVIEIRLSMTHPFMVSFAQTDPDDIEALLRVASAMALAEVLSRRGGVRLAGTVRRNVNDILREALSQPTT